MHPTPPFPPELWEQTPLAVRAYSHPLEARVAALEATVQQLRERLHQDSRHASRPPSRAPPHARPPRPRRGPSGRTRGGQPGHPGQSRTLGPREEVETVILGKPQQCRRCPPPWQGDGPQPSRHQVSEGPLSKPGGTAYQRHPWRCPACGRPPRAERPLRVPPGGFGSRSPAIVELCPGAYRLAQRTPPEVRAAGAGSRGVGGRFPLWHRRRGRPLPRR
jgi:transposase